jgi:hypothetical protein
MSKNLTEKEKESVREKLEKLKAKSKLESIRKKKAEKEEKEKNIVFLLTQDELEALRSFEEEVEVGRIREEDYAVLDSFLEETEEAEVPLEKSSSSSSSSSSASPISARSRGKKGRKGKKGAETKEEEEAAAAEETLEEFVSRLVTRLGRSKGEALPIIATLKNNWYTTVASLRPSSPTSLGLTQEIATSLSIPFALFSLISRELSSSPLGIGGTGGTGGVSLPKRSGPNLGNISLVSFLHSSPLSFSLLFSLSFSFSCFLFLLLLYRTSCSLPSF